MVSLEQEGGRQASARAELRPQGWRWLSWLGGQLLRLDRSLPLAVKVMIPMTLVTVVAIGLVSWMEYRSFRDYSLEMLEERGMALVRAIQVEGDAGYLPQHMQDREDLKAHIQQLLAIEPSLLLVNIYAPVEGGGRWWPAAIPPLWARRLSLTTLRPSSPGRW